MVVDLWIEERSIENSKCRSAINVDSIQDLAEYIRLSIHFVKFKWCAHKTWP